MKAKRWRSLTAVLGLVVLLLGSGCSNSPTETFNRFCKAIEKEDVEVLNDLTCSYQRIDLNEAHKREELLRFLRAFKNEAKTMQPFYEEFFTAEDPKEGTIAGARVYYFVGEPKRARRGGSKRDIQTATLVKEGRHWKLLDIDD